MPHWPKPLGFRPSDFALDRIACLLDRLGNPEKSMPSAVHVAGTNGKGSTISFIAHILQAASLKVHAYTSPHLVDFNERIILCGNKISDAYLYKILEECRQASSGIPLTFFEATTSAAMLAFSRVDADITLMEVGMGGRLDATNVINPIVSVITPISLEHTEYLGSSVELIAGEKAGIIKQGGVCVVAPQDFPSVMQVLEGYAARRRSTIYRGGIEWWCDRNGDEMVFISGQEKVRFPLPSLPGAHQVVNAGSAIAVCNILSGKFGYPISYEDIVDGLQSASWPARLEKITQGRLHDMLPVNWELFLDGAHNPAGAKALARWIDDEVKGPLYVILGMTRDKDVVAFLQFLKERVEFLCAVCVKSEPRAQTAKEICDVASSLGISASAEDSLCSAIAKISHIGNCDSLSVILVCGSLFLAGDVMRENAW